MPMPFFYVKKLDSSIITLDEETSKHMISVLRMKKEEPVLLTDGNGKKAIALITDDNRKKCIVQISSMQQEEKRKRKTVIGISLIKNTSRFEWFLEKATEIGVSEIIPLVCARTENERFRFERLQQILISAMLQSQQCYLPVLHEPIEFSLAVHGIRGDHKFIAHCEEEEKRELWLELNSLTLAPQSSIITFIGPEGDFTKEEIHLALEHHFLPVSLGHTRLRTETAGIVAAAFLRAFW